MADTLPPLPDPMDYCYEWDGPWFTRKFSPNQYNGRRPDRSVALFTADQMRAYAIAYAAAAVQALETERDQLRAEVQALRADKDRIDWLADPENAIGNVQLPREVVEANLHSLRDAIDAARKDAP